MNKVILVGNLTKDPTDATTLGGIKCSRFSVAVNRDYKDKDGNKVTDYLPVVLWRNLAELAVKYLGKGSKVLVEGTLETRAYLDKKGNKVYTIEVVADNIEFLGRPIKKDDTPNP